MGFDFIVIAPLLPSHCSFSFVFGCGVSFLVSSSVFLSMTVQQLVVILVLSQEVVSALPSTLPSWTNLRLFLYINDFPNEYELIGNCLSSCSIFGIFWFKPKYIFIIFIWSYQENKTYSGLIVLPLAPDDRKSIFIKERQIESKWEINHWGEWQRICIFSLMNTMIALPCFHISGAIEHPEPQGIVVLL